MHQSTPDAGSAAGKKLRPTVRRPTPESLADVALIDGPTFAAAVCVSLSELHDRVRRGEAPQPVIRAPRCTRWRLADARQYLIELAAKAQGNSAGVVLTQATKASAAARAKRQHAQLAAA